MDKDYMGIRIKEHREVKSFKRYYIDELTADDITLLEKALEIIKANSKGDPIRSGLSVAYVGINGIKRNNLEVIFVSNIKTLIDKVLDIYNLYGVGVGCSLYAQNFPNTPIAELRDGLFRLL